MLTKLDFKYSKKSFLYISAIILVLDICFVSLNYISAKKTLQVDLQHHAEDHRNAFHISMHMTFRNLLQLATLISQNQTWNQYFLAGKLALEQGDDKAANQARQALLQNLSHPWQKMSNEFQTRQLDYYLYPSNTTFLRVLQPDQYGDSIGPLQQAVADTNAERLSRFGYEIDLKYNGLKGIAPIWARDPNKQQNVFVGAVKVGTSFQQVLPIFAQDFNVDSAVFLSKTYLNERIPEALVEQYFNQHPELPYYLDASTSQEALEVLHKTPINDDFIYPQATIIQDGQRFFSSFYFPLHDYQGNKQPSQPPAGFVLIWNDVSSMVLAFRSAFAMNIVYAIAGFIFIEICLIWGLKREDKLLAAEHSATTDGLTGLFNRRYYDMTIERELGRAKRNKEPLSLIICDIDNFKDFNDLHGHMAGDECLRSIASILQSSAQRSSDVVARYGGEEFTIVLPNTDLQTAVAIAETMRHNVSQLDMTSITHHPHQHLSVSLGVACSQQLSAGETLFEVADQHLYAAKKNGRNRTVSASHTPPS